jgi:hypothetical protein
MIRFQVFCIRDGLLVRKLPFEKPACARLPMMLV